MSFEQKEKQGSGEKPRGKRVCAWCGREFGEFAAEGDTHFICPECRKRFKSGDPEFIKRIKEVGKESVERVEGWKRDMALECVADIEDCIGNTPDSGIPPKDRLKKLIRERGVFIQMQLLKYKVKFTSETTVEQLKEIVSLLKEELIDKHEQNFE